MPSHYAVRIKLCKGVDPRDCQGTFTQPDSYFILISGQELKEDWLKSCKTFQQASFPFKITQCAEALAELYQRRSLELTEKKGVPENH